MAEIVVNTSAMGQYAEPVVTKLGSGGWVVVWQNDQNGIDLAAQIYNANGTKLGGEFKVNSSTAGIQADVKVASLPGGGFITTWIDQNNNSAIVTQRFDAAGAKTGGEITVNTSTTGSRFDSDISVAPDGSYIVSWASGVIVNGSQQTTTQWIARYDAAGNKIGNDLTFASLNNTDADWVALSNGHYAVAYGTGYETRAAFLDIGAGPAALGSSFILNNPDTQPGTTANLSLVRLADGNLAAAWLAYGSGSGFQFSYGVSSRVFNAGGTIGSEAGVTNAGVMLNDIRIGALANGGYAVSWTERDASNVYHSMARAFTGSGDAIGGGFQINLSTVGSAAAASIDGLDAAHMIAVHPGPNVMMQILDVPVSLHGTNDADTLIGTAQPDEFYGWSGADTIDGMGGADEIHGDFGYDILHGGTGDDVIAGDNGVDQIYGDDGDDRLYGNQAGRDAPFHIDIASGFDQGAEADSLFGGAGNDLIWAGLGDHVDGGADTDTVFLYLVAAPAAVTLDFSVPGASMIVTSTEPTEPGSITNVELLGWLEGSAFNDVVIGGTQSEIPGLVWSVQGTIHGNWGNDQLTAGYYTPNVYGDYGDDTINGSDNDDVLIGGYGADTISGGNGRDFLSSDDATTAPFWYGGNFYGPDNFDRRTDVDTLSGGAGDDTISIGYGDNANGGTQTAVGDTLVVSFAAAGSGVTVNFNATTLVIGGGTITGFENIDFVEGSNYADNITLTSTYGGSQNILARAGNDTIVTGASSRFIDGGDGDDDIDARLSTGLQYVTGGAGNDTIRMSTAVSETRGGDGNDTIYAYQNVHGDAGNDLIILAAGTAGSIFSTGDAGNDEMRASTTGSWLAGGAGADHLIGGDGVDRLYSGDVTSASTLVADNGTEHDVIEAGGGNDIVAIGYGDDADGGTGTDTLNISLGGASNGITLATSAFVGAPLSLGGGTIQGFETVASVTGTAFDDVITASAQAAALTLNGGDGNDTLIATTSVTTLNGGNGNDRLVSGTAIDTMIGGAGIDTVDFSALGAGITLTLSVNASVIATASNGDRVVSVEHIIGTNFDDALTGNGDANTIDGGTGADAMAGGAGDDLFIVDNAGDTVIEANTGNADTDTINAYVSWTMGAGQEIERLRAGPGTDPINLTGNEFGQKIVGNNGANTLIGGGGNDNLQGGGGADVLIGGTGLDKLAGGDGADTFVMQIGGELDRITDFATGTDKIDLTAFGSMTFQQVLDATTENGGISTINLGNGDLVQLVGIAKASLSTGDFLLSGGGFSAVVTTLSQDDSAHVSVTSLANPMAIAQIDPWHGISDYHLM